MRGKLTPGMERIIRDAGTYEAAYSTISGCDSTYRLILAVKTVDASVTLDGSVITANATSAAYQWLDCGNNFLPLPGETSQSYTAMTGGRYAVEVTQNECSDTSESIEIIPTLTVTVPHGRNFHLPESGDQ